MNRGKTLKTCSSLLVPDNLRLTCRSPRSRAMSSHSSPKCSPCLGPADYWAVQDNKMA